jgi:uncharacterized FlgJ-related protein
MKKKLTYREQLLELAKIYDVKEVQEYIKRRKNLTSGQIELILRKNKITIPRDFKTNFFKENVSKPLFKVSKKIDELKEESTKTVNKFLRKVSYFKEDSSRSISRLFLNLWRFMGKTGLGFLNMMPKLGETYYNFFSSFFTNLFHGIYNQQINRNKSGKVIIIFFAVIGVSTIVATSINTFLITEKTEQVQVVKKEKKLKKVEIEKPKLKEKKLEKAKIIKPKVKEKIEVKKKEKVPELILPDLNLKTATVLNLFEDVNYDLNTVRYEKKVKPIYFTQFPKDLDEIQSVKLKKETFIKIVLPLVVAENERILDDKFKLKKITAKKDTTDQEKQWLRQKFLEYKVKKGNVDELKDRIDIIPVSIALAQAAKESGWGTSRFALEGNAIFGQWTWNGKGIEPLLKDKTKSHKILRFPILRASVKAYQNNLNTHKSYVKFREKRKTLREKKAKISGLELTKTLINYAETGSAYTKILTKIIIQNRLADFETVRLENSVKKGQLDL